MEGTNYQVGECNKSSSEPHLYSGGLPADIVFSILLKLPVKSLLRYRCVSKELCNIIDSPSFANKHHLSTHAAVEKPEFMHIYFPLRGKDPMVLYSVRYDGNVMRPNTYSTLEFSRHRSTLEFSRNQSYGTHYISYGLFCFHNADSGGDAILFNPLRGEVMILPHATVLPPSPHLRPHPRGLEYYGLGFDGTTDTYKIVRLFYHDQVTYKNLNYEKLATEVYTLGSRSWRRISSGGPPCDVSSPGISVYGDIHWQNSWTYPEEYAEGMINSSSLIISFDSRKEEFSWTPEPNVEDEVYESSHLLDLRGSLAIVAVLSDTALDLWVMRDYNTKEWARQNRVSIEPWARKRNGCPVPDPIQFVGAWEHGLYFDDLGERSIYLYNLKTGCMQCVSHRPSKDAEFTSNYTSKYIMSYFGTMLSLKNYGHSVDAELGPGFSYVFKRANLVYIFP